jgi:hypothetical protein
VNRDATPARTTRTYHFGHPIRTTALASLLAGVVYCLLLAAAFFGHIPTALGAGQLAGAAVIALAVVALTARYEARLAGLRWRDYERMLLIALAATTAPLGAWQLITWLAGW